MLTFSFVFPNLDPVALQIGPFAIRWYALAYIAGIIIGWRYAIRLIQQSPVFMDRTAVDDFIVWVTLGVILGGRLGYVFFYQPSRYLEHPLEALYVWQGGMSFHGGLLGVLFAVYLFARRRNIPGLALGDLVATVAPIGLFFGRLANFVNGELWGRQTDMPWGMIFPNGGNIPRHPSQLYEAAFEGLILFLIMAWVAERTDWRRYPGRAGGIFLCGYALARMSGELFREPDAFLGFFVGGVTMGQILSLPMLIIGLYFIFTSSGRPRLP